MTFDEAFELLIGHEGGYTTGKGDPGGETRYGVSKRSYPQEDIKNLTLERAKAIYLHDFWKPAGCEAVPEAVRFDLFDTAVNSGVKTAIRCLQEAAGVPVDGYLGPKTINALESLSGASLAARFNGVRLEFMTDLPVWTTFSKGWARRIAANLKRL
jgi:lysozyme family protein